MLDAAIAATLLVVGAVAHWYDDRPEWAKRDNRPYYDD